MINLIPLPYRILALTLLAGVLALTCYVGGRRSKQGELDALKRSYEVAAAQAAGREAERARVWANAAKVAGEKFSERAKVADSSFDANLDRLRRAYASGSNRVQPAASVAGSCEAGRVSAGDVLKQGEALAAILRDADRTALALQACVSAWPK